MAAKKKKKRARKPKARPKPKPRARKPMARAVKPKARARKPKARPKARARKPKAKKRPQRRKAQAYWKALAEARAKAHAKRSLAARLGWLRRKLREEREGYAPNEGGTPRRGLGESERYRNIIVLRRMIAENHYAWDKFVERGIHAGLDRRQIINLWFSPKVKKR